MGLLLAEDDLEADLLDGFRFEGEELEVSQIPGRIPFDEAAERLRTLRRELLRPDEIVWSQVVLLSCCQMFDGGLGPRD